MGDGDGWGEALERAEVRAPAAGQSPDLAVARAADAPAAIATGARAIVLEGEGDANSLASAGYHVARWAAVPGISAPEVFLPLYEPSAARYALTRWMVPEARWKVARNRALSALVARGRWPSRAGVVTVATRQGGAPFFVALSIELGTRPGSCFATLGGADDLSRGVFHVFAPGERGPEWVLKFARVPGYSDPFDLDESGLALAARAGGVVARHAPRFVGRLQVRGLEASVETAATGERLVNFLKSPGPRRAKLDAVERVAGWIVDISRATGSTPAELDAERTRLRDEVLPAWADHGVPHDLLDRVAGVGAVFRRGDLGSWNLVVDGDDFTAVDWETAQPHGFPLWDLLYFLSDALALMDGAEEGARRDEYVQRLFRGEERSSAVLFDWVRRAVAASPLAPEQVGAVATLCWLSVGLAHVRRKDRVDAAGSGSGVVVPPAERVAPLWLSDPALGPGWDRWRE